MAHSIDPSSPVQRGFVPARNDEERFLMRHIEDLARIALSRGIVRTSSFLSDREQALAQAALNRAGCAEARFEGGYPSAERRILCIDPYGEMGERLPISCVRIDCRAVAGSSPPEHKDYLGSLMALELRREALGDILLAPEMPGRAYVFALENAARLICRELFSVGHCEVSAKEIPPEELPAFGETERELKTATVSSLRLDAVLAAMLHCSRGMAAELIAAGRVEINHLPTTSAHAPVYPQDVFTVRGKGRYCLTALSGKSKKDRQIIEFFQY